MAAPKASAHGAWTRFLSASPHSSLVVTKCSRPTCSDPARADKCAPTSDIDIAVYVDRAHVEAGTFGYDAELTADLVRALADNRVDLVVLNRAPPLLYHRVLRDGRRLLARDVQATTAREGQALSRYCDYVPQLAKIARAAGDRFRRGDLGRPVLR